MIVYVKVEHFHAGEPDVTLKGSPIDADQREVQALVAQIVDATNKLLALR